MQINNNRALMIIGLVRVGAGVLFFALNFIPGWHMGMGWPMIFFILAALLLAPAVMLPGQREWTAGLIIPAAIQVMLGLIFLYNVITGDWRAWAFAWLLLLSATGLGLILAARFGGWDRAVVRVGAWMLLITLTLFGFFGALFGGAVLKAASPVILIVGGALLLLLSVRRR